MADRIYLLGDTGGLQPMNVASYETEDVLQSLLADYPDLLAGEQIDPISPRRWLLITREMTVPVDEEGRGRLSLDHLFVDQDGVPTLVETKRSTDTRLRREVVAQMLDYAANAVLYWPIERLRRDFERTSDQRGVDADEVTAAFLHVPLDSPEFSAAAIHFWGQVKTNLEAGRIRLIFVADQIPAELRRIVEFLNGQMDPAEVLALEIKQFASQGLRAMVPRIIGQTAQAEQRKGTGAPPQRQWDEPEFLRTLREVGGTGEEKVATQLLAWARSRALTLWWGRGIRSGSFVPVYVGRSDRYQLFAVYTYGNLEVYFQWLATKPPFDSEVKRVELRERLNRIAGVSIPVESISRRPTIPLKALGNGTAIHELTAVFDWALGEIKGAEAQG